MLHVARLSTCSITSFSPLPQKGILGHVIGLWIILFNSPILNTFNSMFTSAKFNYTDVGRNKEVYGKHCDCWKLTSPYAEVA